MRSSIGTLLTTSAACGCVLIYSATIDSADAARLILLHAFAGMSSDGAQPQADLLEDSQGNLYGTTIAGGSNTACANGAGCGTVFEVAASGGESVLYSFDGQTHGGRPDAGLIAYSGNFYGTTETGGKSGCDGKLGCGVVFELTPGGTETVLHAFTSGTDGAFPSAPVVADGNGNLFGTTTNGGTETNCDPKIGCGVVFEIAANGTESVLYAFAGGSDGAFPVGRMWMDSSGDLYGVTTQGGGSGCIGGDGCGTVFKIANGSETILYRFTGGTDGGLPQAGLLADSAGNLYGTTELGGDANCGNGVGCGTVFELLAGGSLKVLHTFGGAPDGAYPYADLARDASGNLYGTTEMGGGGIACSQSTGCGTVFKIFADGREAVLRRLRNPSKGYFPLAGLVVGASGHLFGTAALGGLNCTSGPITGCGTVFEVINNP